MRHEHDWRVLNVCTDWCRCGRHKRVCPKGHHHEEARIWWAVMRHAKAARLREVNR